MYTYQVGDLVLYKSIHLYECIKVWSEGYKFKIVEKYGYQKVDELTVYLSGPTYITLVDRDTDIELIKVDSNLFNLNVYFKNKNNQSVSSGDLILLYIESLKKSVFGVVYSDKLVLTEYGLVPLNEYFLKVFWLSVTEENMYKEHFSALYNKLSTLEILYNSKLEKGILFQNSDGDFFIHLGMCKLYIHSRFFGKKEVNLYLGKLIKCFNFRIRNNLKHTNSFQHLFFDVNSDEIFLLNFINLSYINTIEILQNKDSIEYILNAEKSENIYHNMDTLMVLELIK